MKCPFCQADDTRVTDSRITAEGFTIRRRRQCQHCDQRFTTYETLGENSVMVVKKDASRVPFDRAKIIAGVEKACFKRPISREQMEELAVRVEVDITKNREPEIASTQIGELVMEELRKLDKVAYVRFASVYRDFQDVRDFEQEIRPLL